MSDIQPANVSELNAEQHTALFANLVLQQSNMAMLLMGKTKPPGQEQPMKDLEAARLFIDQLEMIEVKTKGNLSREEGKLLGQTLMALRLAYVEAVDEEPKTPAPAAPQPERERPAETSPASGTTAPTAEESHKKFSKKY